MVADYVKVKVHGMIWKGSQRVQLDKNIFLTYLRT